jgi:hypothetical protein
MIPLFKPNAGFSPSCDAVFVHMAHCAMLFENESSKSTRMVMATALFFIRQSYLLLIYFSYCFILILTPIYISLPRVGPHTKDVSKYLLKGDSQLSIGRL